MINAGFQVGFGALNVLRTVVVAGFISTSEFGILGVAFLAITLAVVIKNAAVGDKYIQQDEADQEVAFQKAFTLELIFAGIMFAGMLVLAPALALAYGQPEVLLPTLAMSLMLPGLALQSPSWVFYRRMDYLRQRLIIAADPIIGFVVTVALAIAGAGYWSLIIGFIVGSWFAGLIAMAMAPYRPRLLYDSGSAREYVGFSWPLMISAGSGMVVAQTSLLAGNAALGLAGAGAIGLSGNLSAYTDSVDRIITTTLYPAICRVADRRDLLLETFTKSNRLTLMWGIPFGVGLTLFAADLVHFVIGDQWAAAIVLLQVFGVTAACNHVGFNWDAYYRAIGQTKPMATVAIVAMIAFLCTAVPLVFVEGLRGFAAGIAVMTAVSLSLRVHYLGRIFPRFEILSYTLRSIAPTLPAAGVVLSLRLIESGPRTIGISIAELAVYLSAALLLTGLFERTLLREAAGYLRRLRPVTTPGA